MIVVVDEEVLMELPLENRGREFDFMGKQGPFVVVSQNTGQQTAREGVEVGLAWSSSEVRVLPREEAVGS